LVLASATDRDFAIGLALSLSAGTTLSADRAIDLAGELAQARADDLALGLSVVLDRAIGPDSTREFALAIASPGGRALDRSDPRSRVLGCALDRAFDDLLALAHLSELDLDLPLCFQFARAAPAASDPPEAIDPIWGSAVTAVVTRPRKLTVLPDSLCRRAKDGRTEIERLSSEPGQEHVNRRLAGVASRISDLVSFDMVYKGAIQPQHVSYIRLGALAIVANVGQLPNSPHLASWYMDIAAGITALERRAVALDPPNEAIVLVKA
jgi:hypothetical protein